MAKTLKDPEERLRRIKLVGEYVLETGASTRKTAEYFTENHFPISNYTVSEYLKEYRKIMIEKRETIDAKINANTPESIDDENVRARVLNVIKLIKAGFTIEEISNSLGVEYWVIYRDIHNRYPKIDSIDYEDIKKILEKRSMDNLNDKTK